jgi:hypothetical protein
MPTKTEVQEVTHVQLRALAELAAPVILRAGYPPGMDKEELKRHQVEEDERRAQAEEAFRTELAERLSAAYTAGAESAVSAEARRAITVRGYVLLGVVAAVVAMPLLAMIFKMDPQAFGSYIAPITGIAGTVVGYWFGAIGQGTSQTEGQK